MCVSWCSFTFARQNANTICHLCVWRHFGLFGRFLNYCRYISEAVFRLASSVCRAWQGATSGIVECSECPYELFTNQNMPRQCVVVATLARRWRDVGATLARRWRDVVATSRRCLRRIKLSKWKMNRKLNKWRCHRQTSETYMLYNQSMTRTKE